MLPCPLGVTPETFVVDFGAGEFGVKNVQLKLDRFKEIETPVEIKHVSLGDVRLTIPALWKLLKSPIKVKAEKLFIVVGPSDVAHYTIDERKARMKATKKMALFVMGIIGGVPTPPEYDNDKEKRDKTRKMMTSPELFGLPGILKKLIPIVDNVQVEVGNIHIRYEDALSKPTNPFAVGVTLDNVAIRGSTTAEGEDTFVTTWNIDNFRKVFLNNFSLYIDTETRGAAPISDSATKQRMQDLIYRAESAPNAYSPDHEFLLQPLSVGARAQWHRGYEVNTPMIYADAVIPHVGLTLSHAQYSRTLDAAFHYKSYASRLKFGYLAPPQQSAQENPRAWWRYVMGCVLRRVRHRMKRYDAARVFKRLSDRTRYVNIKREQELLGNGWVSSADQKALEEMETSHKYKDIIEFRKIAKLSLMKDKFEKRITPPGFVAKAAPALKIATLVAAVSLVCLIMYIWLDWKPVLAFALVAISGALGAGFKFFFGKPEMLPFDQSEENWAWIYQKLDVLKKPADAPVIEKLEPIFPKEYSMVKFKAEVPRLQLDVNMFGTRPYDSSVLTLAIDGIHASGDIAIPAIHIKASVDTINAVERISLHDRHPLHLLSHIYPRTLEESAKEEQRVDPVLSSDAPKVKAMNEADSSYSQPGTAQKTLSADQRSLSRHVEAQAAAKKLAQPQIVFVNRVDVSKLQVHAQNPVNEIAELMVLRRFVNVDVAVKPDADLDLGVKATTTTFNVNVSMPFVSSMLGFFVPQKNKAEIKEMTQAASHRFAVAGVDSVKAAIRERQVIALDIRVAGPTVVVAQNYTPKTESDAIFVRLGPVTVASNPQRVSDPDNWKEDDCYDLYKVDARNVSLTMQRGVWHDCNTARRVAISMSTAEEHTYSEIDNSLRQSIAIEELSDVDHALRPLLDPQAAKLVSEEDDTDNDASSDDSDHEGASDDSDVEHAEKKKTKKISKKKVSASERDEMKSSLESRPSIEEPATESSDVSSEATPVGYADGSILNQPSSSAAGDETMSSEVSAAIDAESALSSPSVEEIREKKHKKAKKNRKSTEIAEGAEEVVEGEEGKKKKKLKSSTKEKKEKKSKKLSSKQPRVEEPFEIVEKPVMEANLTDAAPNEEDYLLKPLSVALKAYVCVAGSVVGMPATRLVGDVTSVDLIVSPHRMHKLLAICMAQFPPMTPKKVKKAAHAPLTNVRPSYTPAGPDGLASVKPADPNATAAEYEQVDLPSGRLKKRTETVFVEKEGEEHHESAVKVVQGADAAPSATVEEAKATVAQGEVPPPVATEENVRETQEEAEKADIVDDEVMQTLNETAAAAAEVAEEADSPVPGTEPRVYAPVSDLEDDSGYAKYEHLNLPDFRPLLVAAFSVVGVNIYISQDSDANAQKNASTINKSAAQQKAEKHAPEDPLPDATIAAVEAVAATTYASVVVAKPDSLFASHSARVIAKLVIGPVTANVDVNPFITSVSASVSSLHLEEFVDESFQLTSHLDFENKDAAKTSERRFIMTLTDPEFGALTFGLKSIPRVSPVYTDTLTDIMVKVGQLEVNVRRPALLILAKLAVACVPKEFVMPAFGVHPALPIMKISDLPIVSLEEEIKLQERVLHQENEPAQSVDEIKAEQSSASKGTNDSVAANASSSTTDASSSASIPAPTTVSVGTDAASPQSNAAEATDTKPETSAAEDPVEPLLPPQGEHARPEGFVAGHEMEAIHKTVPKGEETKTDSKDDFVLTPIPVDGVSTVTASPSTDDMISTQSGELSASGFYAAPSSSSLASPRSLSSEDDSSDEAVTATTSSTTATASSSDANAGTLPVVPTAVGGPDLRPVLVEVETDDGVVENLREKESTRLVNVRADVPTVRVHLLQETTKLLSLSVTGIVAAVDVRGDSKISVQGRVSRMSVDASHEGIGGVNMICLPDEKAHLVAFTFGLTPSTCSDYVGYDMGIAAEIAQLKVIYYHLVIMTIVQWANNMVEPLLVILRPLQQPIKLSHDARRARRAYRKSLVASGDEFMLRMSSRSLINGEAGRKLKKSSSSVPSSSSHSRKRSSDVTDGPVIATYEAPLHPVAQTPEYSTTSPAVATAAGAIAAHSNTHGSSSIVAEGHVDDPKVDGVIATPKKSSKKSSSKKDRRRSRIIDESGDDSTSNDDSDVETSQAITPRGKKSKKSKKTSKGIASTEVSDDQSGEEDSFVHDSDDSDAPISPRSTGSAEGKKKKKTKKTSTTKKHRRGLSNEGETDDTEASIDASITESVGSPSVGLTDAERRAARRANRKSLRLPTDANGPNAPGFFATAADESEDPLSPLKKSSRSSIKRTESSSGKKKKSTTSTKKKPVSKEPLPPSAPKIKIDAKIISPIVIVPINPHEIETGGHLEVHAGHIEVTNEVAVAGDRLITDTMTISLTHLNMAFHKPKSVQMAPRVSLMDHTGFNATIQRVLGGDETQHTIPKVGVDAEMLPVHMSFGTPQLDLVFRLLTRHILLPVAADYEVAQYFRPLTAEEKAYFEYEKRMLAALETQQRVAKYKEKYPNADPLSPAADSFTMVRVAARVLHFALDICDQHSTPQLRIDVRQLGALATIQSDSFIAAEAALQAIDIIDTVISTEHFNNVFAKPTRVTNPMIQAAFVLNPQANAMGLKAAVHSPTIVVLPETILRLKNTWEKPVMEGIKGLEQIKSPATTVAPPSTVIVPASTTIDGKTSSSSHNAATGLHPADIPSTTPTIKCGVLIHSPMIAIVPVANSNHTPAFTIDLGEIVLNADLDLPKKQISASAGISNLRVIRSFLTAGTLQSADEQFLLHPMELKSGVALDGNKMKVSALIPLVQFITSFRDVDLVMRILEAYKPLLDSLAPPADAKGTKGTLDHSTTTAGVTTTTATAQTSTEAATETTKTHVEDDTAKQATEIPESEKSSISASIEITAIDIAIIDDRFKHDFFVPIFRMTLGPMHGRFAMVAEKMDGTVAIRNVAASVYNRAYGGWEPTIEPWEMSAGFQKDKSGIAARMIAEKILEVTVNQALLEAVFELLEIVVPPKSTRKERKDRKKKALKPTLDPLVVRNWTGMPITVQIKDVSEPFAVGLGESRPLLMKRQTRAQVIAKPPKYTFSVFVDGATAPAKLSATRVDTIIVPYKVEDPASIYVAEVETEAGSRLITIRGSYKVTNTTGVAIELMLVNADGTPVYSDSDSSADKKEPQIITVEPDGGTFCASILQSATRSVRVRAIGYEWSDVIQFTQPKPAYVLCCKERKENGGDPSTTPAAKSSKALPGFDWYATARVDIGKDGDDYALVIAPPINVENLTTVPLQVKFVNSKKEKELAKAFAKEEKQFAKDEKAKEKELKQKEKDAKKQKEKDAKNGKTQPDDASTPADGITPSSSVGSALNASSASVPQFESVQALAAMPTWDVVECDDEDVHELPSFDETLAICVKLPKFGWSRPLPFITKVDLKRTDKFDSDMVLTKVVEVPDETGHMMKVGIDVSPTDTAGRNVKIYARTWIVNDTGLPLFFKKDKDEKQLAAGQSKVNGYDIRMHTDGNKRELKNAGTAALSASTSAVGLKSRLENEDQQKWYENPEDLIVEAAEELEDGETEADIQKTHKNLTAPTVHHLASARDLKKNERAKQAATISAATSSTNTEVTSTTSDENISTRSLSPGYGPYYYYGESRVSVALENSTWSDAADLGVRSEGTVDIEDSNTGRLYSFFISVTPGPARFWRTSVVRIYPRFVLSNTTKYDLILRQISESHSAPTVLKLKPGQMLPYHWTTYKRPQLMAAHIAQNPNICTAYFGLDQVGRFPLRFHDTSKPMTVNKNGKLVSGPPVPIPSLIDDDVIFSGLHVTNVGDSSIFVRFLDDTPDEYFSISNQSSVEIAVREAQPDSKLKKIPVPLRKSQAASLKDSSATVEGEESKTPASDSATPSSSTPAIAKNPDDLDISEPEEDIDDLDDLNDDEDSTDFGKSAVLPAVAGVETEGAKKHAAETEEAKKRIEENSGTTISTDADDSKSLAKEMKDTREGAASGSSEKASEAKAAKSKSKSKDGVEIEVDNDEAEARGAQIYVLKPKRKEPFMFPRPQFAKHKIQFQLPGDPTWHTVNLDKIEQSPSIKLAHRRYLHIRTVAVGQSKQLIIKIATKEAKSDEEQLAAAEGSKTSFELLMAGMGVSIVDQRPQELLYLRMGGLSVNAGMSSIEQNLEVKLGMLQIDNDLYMTPHSVVAHSIDQPDADPFFHLAMVRDMRYQKFFCFRYFSMKMHKLATKLDMAFAMNGLCWGLTLLKWIGDRTAAEVEYKTILGEGEGKIKTPMVSATSNGFYFEVFHLNPMSFLISFVPSSNFDCPNIDDSSAEMIASIAPHLITIDTAPLFLGGLLMTNCFTSQDEFIARITAHYVKSVLKQLLMLAGSADALGNPVSLVNSLGTGVYDLVHEPAAGATHSPAQFGIGIAKGTGSLLKNSLGGVLATAEKLVGNVSKLGEKLSMDKEYQQERERMKMRKANNVGAGVAFGLKELGQGVFQGLSGLVTQPTKGAKNKGFKGFAQGIGKGLVGVVVKPTVGVVDLVTRTTEGIRNTGSDTKPVPRVRDPRYIGSDHLLPVYDAYKAEGQLFLRTINDGKYSKEYYAWHKAPSPKAMVLVTDSRIMYLKMHAVEKVVSGGSKWSVKWREQMLVFDERVTRDESRHRIVLHEKGANVQLGNTLNVSKSALSPIALDAPEAESAPQDNTLQQPEQPSPAVIDTTSTAKDGNGKKDKKDAKKDVKKDKKEKHADATTLPPTSSKQGASSPTPSTSTATTSSDHSTTKQYKIKYVETADADEIQEQLTLFIADAPIQRPRAKALSLLGSINPLGGLLGRGKDKKKEEKDKKEKKDKKTPKSNSLNASETPKLGAIDPEAARSKDYLGMSSDSLSDTHSGAGGDLAGSSPALVTPSKKDRRKSITSPPLVDDGKKHSKPKRAETDLPTSSLTPDSAASKKDKSRKSPRRSTSLATPNPDISESETASGIEKSPRKEKKAKKDKSASSAALTPDAPASDAAPAPEEPVAPVAEEPAAPEPVVEEPVAQTEEPVEPNASQAPAAEEPTSAPAQDASPEEPTV